MSATKKLNASDIRGRMSTLPGWVFAEGKLSRTFEFKDFEEAFGFMTRVAAVAQELDHHPDWMNVYNRVAVQLWTHSIKGVSERDFVMAERMNGLEGQES